MLVWETARVSPLLHSDVLKESTSRELLKLGGSSPSPLTLPSSDSTTDLENMEAALSIIDNHHLLDPPEQVFAANDAFAIDIAEAGLTC